MSCLLDSSSNDAYATVSEYSCPKADTTFMEFKACSAYAPDLVYESVFSAYPCLTLFMSMNTPHNKHGIITKSQNAYIHPRTNATKNHTIDVIKAFIIIISFSPVAF